MGFASFFLFPLLLYFGFFLIFFLAIGLWPNLLKKLFIKKKDLIG